MCWKLQYLKRDKNKLEHFIKLHFDFMLKLLFWWILTLSRVKRRIKVKTNIFVLQSDQYNASHKNFPPKRINPYLLYSMDYVSFFWIFELLNLNWLSFNAYNRTIMNVTDLVAAVYKKGKMCIRMEKCV